jgi:hypothetical protein
VQVPSNEAVCKLLFWREGHDSTCLLRLWWHMIFFIILYIFPLVQHRMEIRINFMLNGCDKKFHLYSGSYKN